MRLILLPLIIIGLFLLGYAFRKVNVFKKKRTWLILLLVPFLIYVFGNITSIQRNVELKFEQLPEEYKDYAHVGRLDSAFINSNLKAIKFESIYEEEIIRVNDSVIALKIHKEDTLTDKTDSFWYKINPNGDIADSLIFRNEYIDNVDSYLINSEKDYYVTWLKTGDTLKRPFQLLEDGEILNKEESIAHLEDAAYSNYTYFYDNEADYDNRKRFQKVVFYKNNQWFQFYTRDDLYLPVDRYYVNKKLQFKDKGELVYFQKEQWRGEHFPNFNLYLNGKDPDHWRGQSFLNLKIRKDTLKLQHYSKMYVNQKARQMPLDIYESPNKNFQILRLNIVDSHTFYVIK